MVEESRFGNINWMRPSSKYNNLIPCVYYTAGGSNNRTISDYYYYYCYQSYNSIGVFIEPCS